MNKLMIEHADIDTELIPILDQVSDPEIPVLTVLDMGVVRYAKLIDGLVSVKLTPTYSGCPAMDVITDDISAALKKAGYKVNIDLVLTPAWTTDWISEEGRDALDKFGIAPPLEADADKEALLGNKK